MNGLQPNDKKVALKQDLYYKYNCSMKRTKRYAGRGGSTRRLHHKHYWPEFKLPPINLWNVPRQYSVYDGGEQGSTGAE